MLTKAEFDEILERRSPLIIDGALATELEARGQDLNHPLWSAKTLQENPESIEQVHLDYFLAGADVAITASYQATTKGLEEHFGLSEAEGSTLIKRCVALAQKARDKAYAKGVGSQRRLLIAGSVGPYGAYLADGSEYRGGYDVAFDQMKDFHRPRIQALVEAGVDLLALETMPNLAEIKALLDLLDEEFPTAIAWLSCTVRSPKALSDGTPWEEVLLRTNQSQQILGFGINCVPLSLVHDTLKAIRQCTSLPLVVYPNSGESWDAANKIWVPEASDAATSGLDATSEEARRWFATGAKLIGGCCRTGPKFIEAISMSLHR